MIEIFEDIETLKNVLIALEEGASDERRAAQGALQKMLENKICTVEQFEAEFDKQFDNLSA